MDTKNKEKISLAKYKLSYVIARLSFIKADEGFLNEQRDSREYILEMLINNLEEVKKTIKELREQNV